MDNKCLDCGNDLDVKALYLDYLDYLCDHCYNLRIEKELNDIDLDVDDYGGHFEGDF